MDLHLESEDQALRDEIRAFIRDHLPDDLRRRAKRDYHPRKDDIVAWTKILANRGWSVPAWPREYGGPGWTPFQRYIFETEMRAAGAPVGDRIGVELVAPVLFTFGSNEQCEEHLPPIRNADVFWAQGFSEPGAGSDLSALRTRAERDGGHYIVNGQKTWTTEAHHADMIFALVRTDMGAKPQRGISALLIDMHDPGVTSRPIWTIDEGLSVNEVFFDNVRVPVNNLVGAEGAGWTYAKFLLANERVNSAEVPHTKHDIAQLRRIAAIEQRNGRPLLEDARFREALARIEIDTLALEYAVLRVLAEGDENNPVASLVKVRGSELRQRVAELATDALGMRGLAVLPDPEGEHRMIDEAPANVVPEHGIGISAKAMFRRATTIYGGANEIQRTLIAKKILQL